MLQKSLASLAVPVLLFTLSCQPRTESTATDSASTDASTTTVTTAVATSTDQEVPLPPPGAHAIDHYKFWRVKQLSVSRPVTLKGQFDQAPWQANTVSIVYLGNPVEKNGAPILKSDWHLNAYRLNAPPQPIRTIQITNQFVTNQTLKTTSAAWLLVPAGKSLTGTPTVLPQGADHYLCYTIQPAPAIAKQILLRDQFDKKQEQTEKITKIIPMFFCVPVSKNGGPIHKPAEHLTIYRIDPVDPYQVLAYTYDQFGPHNLTVEQSELLAVPTFKQWNQSF